jgi:hypothetical protein
VKPERYDISKYNNTYMTTLEPGESGLQVALRVRRGTRWLHEHERDDNVVHGQRYTRNDSEDLCLCQWAFLGEQCPAGAECRWRHHPVTAKEVAATTGLFHKHMVKLLADYAPQEHMVTRWDAEAGF